MGSTPSTRRCWPTRSVWRWWWYSKPWLPPSGSPSCCTTCTRCLARGADFDALVAVLGPDVVLRADSGAMRVGASTSREVHGAPAAARRAAKGRARAARPALVDGAAGVVVAPRGRLLMVLGFTIRDGKIVEIDAIADPARLRQLDLAVLDD